MIITLALNGGTIFYLHVFLTSFFLFGICIFILSKLTSNIYSRKTVAEIIVLDISIAILFIYSLIGNQKEIVLIAIWALIPLRNITILFAKKYNISGVYRPGGQCGGEDEVL
jgi:hypothetical protein